MKTKLSLLVLALVLQACATDKLGRSCNATQSKILNISKLEQKFGTSWCWAATAQNVMDFHGTKAEQCELVAKVYSMDQASCCGNTVNDCWGENGHPEWVFDQFQFSFLPPYAHNKNLTWEQATDEICQNRPFISSLDLTMGDRHSVVVTGYDVKRGVRIYDPVLNDFMYESSANFFHGESPNYTRFRDTYNIKPKR